MRSSGWVFTFAGQKKSGYIASVILAVIGAAFQILPFFVMAQVIGKLLSGNKDLAGYLIDCAIIAAFWLLRVLLYSLSTAQSHKATFAVLRNIRKQGLTKLAKMPLGDVQSKGSGELKNILVERVDSIKPMLAHVIPEMSSNAAVALATLIYLFVIDCRMAFCKGIYTDEGISSCNTKHRTGFNEMTTDALSSKIDLIVTKPVSRFARNTVDSLVTIRKLKEKGVEVFFQKENIYTFDGKGELLLTIMSSLAQEKSRSISENVTWGQRKRFADGKVSLPYKQFLG